MTANDPHDKMQNGIDTAISLADEADYRLGELLVRPSSRELVLRGKTEMAEPRVMQVLTALARRRGEVVSRDQLVEACWGGRVVSEDAINRSITKVRRWSTPSTFTLETIPRVGYRLIAANEKFDAAPAVTAQPAIAASSRRYSRRRKVVLGFVAVLSLFFVFGAWFGFQTWQDANRPYFAVLQFDAASTDADAVALVDALATTINHRLTEQGFRVVSPALSSQYRGARKAEAATALGPRYVIDGSVRREGTHLRVAARIDATIKPVTVWSREFVVGADEVREQTEKIGMVLAGLFNPAIQSSPLLPPEVAAGMLRINALRFQGNDLEAYIAAKQLLREVPTHYTPQIWYATSVAEALDVLPSADRAAILAEARQAAERAEQMVWGTLPGMQFALIPTAQWSAREQVLRDALAENIVEGANSRYLLSTLLVSSGQNTEAVDIANQAAVMNRASARFAAGHASALDVAGRREQADKVLDYAERLWPNVEFIERLRFGSAVARGDLGAASALLQDPVIGPLLDPPAERRPFTTILRALEKREPADIAAVERDCADPSKLARDRASWCLQALVALGRLDTFFDVSAAYFPEQRGATAADRDAHWLQAPRVGRYVRVLFRSDMKAARTDPRFIPIVERLGLLDYWRSSGKWPDFCKTEPASVCSRMQQE